MTLPAPPLSPTAATFERQLRRLPADRLLDLADTLRRAALAFDRGTPDRALDELATAAELLDAAPAGHDRHNHADALGLLDRARFDLERGWHAAAYDCLARALRLLFTQPEVTHHD
ncbi:MAG: hypothetical protein M0038_06815 [Pseudomonadota bacterium]|nr:hypothetical protein [Pseudomonadota bacterium]